jgi:Acyclic terpene utilisation family protein AtuA
MLSVITIIKFLTAGIRVVSNAGGINPLACASAIEEAAKRADVDLKVAVVTGDDLMPQVELYIILSMRLLLVMQIFSVIVL